MNISLTTPLENYVQEKLDSGMYASASEVIRAGLRALRDKDLEANIVAGIEQGLADVEAGRVRPFDANYAESLKSRIRNKAAQ